MTITTYTTQDADRVLGVGDQFLEDWEEDKGKDAECRADCAERRAEWNAYRPLFVAAPAMLERLKEFAADIDQNSGSPSYKVEDHDDLLALIAAAEGRADPQPEPANRPEDGAGVKGLPEAVTHRPHHFLPKLNDAVACANCDWRGDVSETEEYRDFWSRVEPGETIPHGDCPECGAFCYAVKPEPAATSPYLNKKCLSERERKAVDFLRLLADSCEPDFNLTGDDMKKFIAGVRAQALEALAAYDG